MAFSADFDVKPPRKLEAGAHPKVVQDLLRHSTVLLTLDTYSHITDTLSSQAADIIDLMFEGVVL